MPQDRSHTRAQSSVGLLDRSVPHRPAWARTAAAVILLSSSPAAGRRQIDDVIGLDTT
jgi:hypothetical protein